jgi:hypothetical protein
MAVRERGWTENVQYVITLDSEPAYGMTEQTSVMSRKEAPQ